MMMSDAKTQIFALDIGTRTVTGVVVDASGQVPRVLGSITLEHRSRAMLDGQIHDIDAVARVVREVKDALEEKLGLTLTNAAVAAAGRALLTRKAKVDKEIAALGEIQVQDVREWELESVQRAQTELREETVRSGVPMSDDPATIYHCVGYSILVQTLDGTPIRSLVGHRGRSISLEVLATFLPEVVVDSLYAVLRRANLEVSSMTLEPIAASNVVIPPDLRQLNLSLVDVGAGTSDIAITRHGSVIAYGMVPIAGDEVSEQLCEHYLLDFNTAERLKREVAAATDQAAEINFMDVLGNAHCVPVSEVLREIEPSVENLTTEVANCILALNEKAPSAVICIGGGSLTPLLAGKLQEKLGLAPGRVAVRGREALQIPIDGDLSLLTGPEAVTPVGIALSAPSQAGLAFRSTEVVVNGRRVRLFNLVEPTVADAILSAGVDVAKLRGRLGLALTAKVNGEFKHIRGTVGEPGRILLNGEPASLETRVADFDTLTVSYATDGVDARAVVSDLLPVVPNVQVSFNGRRVTLKPTLKLNGRQAGYDEVVPDGADLEFAARNTLSDLLEIVGAEVEGETIPFTYYYNGVMHSLPASSTQVLVNGAVAPAEAVLRDGDRVEFVSGAKARPRISDILAHQGAGDISTGKPITVTVNGAAVLIPGTPGSVRVNGVPARGGELVPEGAVIEIDEGADAAAYFAEIFNHVPMVVPERPSGKRLITLLNGVDAEYTAPLRDGDEIEIFWEGERP